ncbi:MAG: ArsR family transcriptional regulator [Candidatus Diapherotrites archaeon]|nr:ArsR family transcriptional regulator [Candidatus Diapherotrites archaeon]
MRFFECERRSRRILPLVKRALIEELHRRGLSVSEIARILDLTPAAVSQYLHGKRGKGKVRIRGVEELAERAIRGELRQEDICRVCDELASRG